MSAAPRRLKVVCAVIERGGEILAARRKPHQSNGNLWEFPGGKVRDAELPAEALHREIREELGVGVTIRRELEAIDWDYPGRRAIELLPFDCVIDGAAEPRPLDHSEIRFVARKEALSLSWSPADRVIVDRYFGGAASSGADGEPSGA